MERSQLKRYSKEIRRTSGEDFFGIGIDFGTTFTKVAWTFSKRPEIQMVTTWPGGNTFKVPSTLRYQNGNEKVFGFHAPATDPKTLEWFKLLLIDDKDPNGSIQSCKYMIKAKSDLKGLGKEPMDVVKDYLAEIWQYTVEYICSQQRRSIVELFPFRVVLTVPATWAKSPDATARLEEAAKRAGILDDRAAGKTEFQIMAEPEAATLATLTDADEIEEIGNGDVFIMCDAGGGTVDLTTYEMKDNQTLQLQECVEGDGAACGSIFLDEHMEECMDKWLGRRWTGLSEWEKKKFRDKWSANKSLYTGLEQQAMTAEIGKSSKVDFMSFRRGKSGLQIDDGLVKFERDKMALIFAPVVKQIIQLVGCQINKTKASHISRAPKILILCGGLGANKYIKHQLQLKYPGLDIIQRTGDKPITAVCRGAVYKAMTLNQGSTSRSELLERIPIPGVISRVATLSYGISYTETYDPAIHSIHDKIYDPAARKEVAQNLMHWYVMRGEDVSEIDRPSYTFCNRVNAPLPGNRFVVQIWKCNSKTPPESRREREDVLRCTEVSCRVDIPFHDLPRCERNPAYREIFFQLDLVLNGPRLEFLAKMNGEIRGRSDISLNYS